MKEFAQYLDGKVRPSTARLYVFNVGRWLNSVGRDTPTPDSAQMYIDELAKRLNASTVNTRAHAISKWFEWQGVKADFKCPSVSIPLPEYLLIEDVKRLLAATRNQLETTFITVLFDSGVRVSELINIRLGDIDWQNNMIKVTRKGGSEDEVNVTPKAMKTIDDWLNVRDMTSKRVFGDLTYIRAWRMIRNVGARVGIKVHPHMLRHSRAVHMRMNGATLEDIKDHLRHRNINTTSSIYSRLKPIDLKERIPTW